MTTANHVVQEKHVLRGTLDHQKAAQQGAKGGTTRMLAAYLDAGAKIEMQGDRQKIDADLRGLRIETQTNVSRSSKVDYLFPTCPHGQLPVWCWMQWPVRCNAEQCTADFKMWVCIS